MGESQLGLFSAANYLTIVGTTLVTALGAPSAVKLAKYYTAGNAREFKHLVFKLMSVGAAIGMMGIITSILAGKQILELAYKKQYAEMSGVLTVLCVASAVAYSSSYIGWAMTAAGKFKVQVPIFLFLAAFTGCTCYVFIGRYGIAGAALGVLAGSIAQLALTALVIGRAVRECDQDRCTREKQLYEGAY
jgi:O-antigen/teichoic acid export membrane protein